MFKFNKPKQTMFEQIGIVGCGLMGGSFALAMKRAGLAKRIVGYSKSPTTTSRALQLGVIDVEVASALQAVSGSDMVLIAVPVSATEGTFKAIKHLLTPHILVMDVGSTKQDAVDAAQRTLGAMQSSFVPAHPIAGKELAGVEHADVDLYAGRQVILTPTEKTSLELVKKAEAVWSALGCTVRKMTPEAHDAAFAAVSHLPHLLAFALMNSIASQKQGEEFLSMAGTGFRDFTRIAASDPKMWHDIFLSNRIQMTEQIDQFKQTLDLLSSMIASNDSASLSRILASASRERNDWQLSSATQQK